MGVTGRLYKRQVKVKGSKKPKWEVRMLLGPHEEYETGDRIVDANGHIRPLAEIQAEVIDAAIGRYKTMTEVARRLQVGRSTLYRKTER